MVVFFGPPNYLQDEDTSFRIADLRDMDASEPHYHIDETEIYYVMEGEAYISIAEEISHIRKDQVIVTPPETAHFLFGIRGLVLGVINTPEFSSARQISLVGEDTATNPTFDRQFYYDLTEPARN